MTTVLICDDHRIVREGLRQFVAGVPGVDRVDTAASGEEVLARYEHEQPDLILMDVRMPGMDGLEATREIKRERPEIGILMVTMHDDPDYMLEAIRSGAAGYVLKDASWEDLTASVRGALSGDFPMDPDVAAKLLQRLARETPEVSNSSPPTRRLPDPLTPRELEVLEHLTLGRTNTGIAQDLTISVGTVKTHVQHVIKKLGVSDRTQAAVRAVELRLVQTAS